MSYPSYTEYKDSGVEWLGKIPVTWNIKRLKYVCKTQTGGKDAVNAVDDGEYPFFVRSQAVKRINSYTADCEAVLIAGDGAVGKIFHYYEGRFDYHQRVYMLNDFNNIQGKYIYFYLKSNFYKIALDGGAKSTVDSLRLPLFLNFEVVMPSRDEQKQIVTFLDRETQKIDRLIEKQQQLIKLLQEKRQAVISHAVAKGLNPNATMKDSGIEWLGNIPIDWNVKPIKYVSLINSDVLNENTDGDYEFEYIDIGGVTAGIGIQKTEKLRFSSAPSRARRLVKNGDVIVSTVRTYLRAIAPIKEHAEKYVVSTGFCVVTPIDNLNPDYCSYMLQSPYFVETVVASSVGVSYPATNASDIANIDVCLPTYEEQKRIVTFLDEKTKNIDCLIDKCRKAIELSNERRATLISTAVTGEIDVRSIV